MDYTEQQSDECNYQEPQYDKLPASRMGPFFRVVRKRSSMHKSTLHAANPASEITTHTVEKLNDPEQGKHQK